MREADIDALYRRPLREFVAARNALARTLRANGERARADRVKALSKPSVSAWAVNQLWWHEPGAFEALLQAVDRIREAQGRQAGPTRRGGADRQRRTALTGLLHRAETILQEAGHGAAPATLRRIGTTLEAVAARGPDDLDPPIGRLSTDLEPPGFDRMGGMAAAREGGLVKPPGPAGGFPGPASSREATSELRDEAREGLRVEVDAARRTVDEAARAVDEVLREADEARLAAIQARSEAEETEARAQAALQSAREARRRAELAGRNADRHENTLARRREALESATKTLAAAEQRLREAGTSRAR